MATNRASAAPVIGPVSASAHVVIVTTAAELDAALSDGERNILIPALQAMLTAIMILSAVAVAPKIADVVKEIMHDLIEEHYSVDMDLSAKLKGWGLKADVDGKIVLTPPPKKK